MFKFHQLFITKFCSYRSVFIPKEKLECKFSKSSGPGGQHVNKTNSKAEIRFNLQTADWLSSEQKNKFIRLYPNYVNKEGEIIIILLTLPIYQQVNLPENNLKIQKMQMINYEKWFLNAVNQTKINLQYNQYYIFLFLPPPSQNKVKQRIQCKRQKSDVKKTRNIK